MFLQRIDIANFRGISDLSLKLDKTTVLIGENNAGKSTILDALHICLSRSLTRRGDIFSEYDYHLAEKGSQPVDSDAIDIRLHFAEENAGEWPNEIPQILSDAIQIDDDGLQSVILRVTSQYDDATEGFSTTWDFLDLAGNELTRAKTPRYIIQLQQLAPVFYLSALRDAAQEFRPRSQFWGPFVQTLKIDPDLRKQLEENLSEINQQILDAHEAFASVKEQLRNTSKMVPLDADDPVEIEAIPGKVFDMLSRTQVLLTSKGGAQLPIGRHGEGTQSLAVICLFDAFLQARLKDGYLEHTAPILALEEPEAHLHPSGIRAVTSLLQSLNGQKIIATHSGDLIAGVPLSSLRRLRRKDGIITVHQIEADALTEDEIHKLDYHVRNARGNLLFARCWLLVEGESDCVVFEECARICGYDLVSEGICCIEYTKVGVEKFIKLADQLGIEWVVVADGDSSGADYIQNAKNLIGDRSENRHLHTLVQELEVFLCMEGYGSIYEENISEQKKHSVTADKGTLEYWQQVVDAQPNKSKPKNAIAIIESIEEKGQEGVPTQLREIVEQALELSTESR